MIFSQKNILVLWVYLGCSMSPANARISMNELAYKVEVSEIATNIWNKFRSQYGLTVYKWSWMDGNVQPDSADAYAEIKNKVRDSIWTVSTPHVKLLLKYFSNFNKLTNTMPSGAVLSSLSFPFDAETAANIMVNDVVKELQSIIKKNTPFFWQVKFTNQHRFLLRGELSEGKQRRAWSWLFTPGKSSCVPNDQQTTVFGFDPYSPDCHVFAVPTEIEAEEAIDEIAQGYVAAGMPAPIMQIVAFNSGNEEIPNSNIYSGKFGTLRNSYSKEEIPAWCRMPLDEHNTACGCWGIATGEVAMKGVDHCKMCEYYWHNIS